MSPKSVAKICLRKRSVQLRLSSSVQSVARPSYSQSSFLSGKGSGTLRSSVVHSPGRASSNPLAWLASPLPGLFPLPPTRPASVVPGLSTSAPRRDYNGDQGRCPPKSHAAAPPAVPALHVRSYKSAGWTGLTTPRSWQFTSTSGPPPGVSIDTPLLLHPIASMQVCAAGVDRSYPSYLPLPLLLARAGETGGVEHTGQNQ